MIRRLQHTSHGAVSSMQRTKETNAATAAAAEEQNTVTPDVKFNIESISDVIELTLRTLDSINQAGKEINRVTPRIRRIVRVLHAETRLERYF